MPTPISARAVLFDVDGTLVDSNQLHVDAWQRAFDALGLPVDSWRIHRSIGQDAGRLISELAGERDEEWQTRAKDLHAEYYAEFQARLRAFESAARLLRELHGRGIRVVLATSAPSDELERLKEAIGADDAVDAETSADDVETAKPDPGIVKVALERAGVTAADALFIGDSTWDMVAAGKAGVPAVGVRCGGTSDGELIEAGALAVFDDPSALLAALESGELLR